MATKRPRAEEEKVWDAFQNCWTINGEPVDNSNESDGEEFVSLKERRALREERLRKQRKRPVAEEEVEDEAPSVPEPQQQRALVDEAEDLRRQQQGMDKEKTKRAEEEARAKRSREIVGVRVGLRRDGLPFLLSPEFASRAAGLGGSVQIRAPRPGGEDHPRCRHGAPDPLQRAPPKEERGGLPGREPGLHRPHPHDHTPRDII